MSDDEDAVAALLDELAEAPPDDALDAAAERLAEDALAAACAEELEDAAARDVVNEAVVDAAADRIVESAIKTAGNEIDAADEALAASATELLIEHAIIDAAAETDDQDDRTSADTVARVQTEVATTIIEGAIDTLKDDDTLDGGEESLGKDTTDATSDTVGERMMSGFFAVIFNSSRFGD